jgi:hypothetical protein
VTSNDYQLETSRHPHYAVRTTTYKIFTFVTSPFTLSLGVPFPPFTTKSPSSTSSASPPLWLSLTSHYYCILHLSVISHLPFLGQTTQPPHPVFPPKNRSSGIQFPHTITNRYEAAALPAYPQSPDGPMREPAQATVGCCYHHQQHQVRRNRLSSSRSRSQLKTPLK